ncbi:MAG: MFS transporter [Chloroflexi bacterium]|nr:MFS transporter [Chloroflexota bacterium]MDA1145348.1 MFS transporter [Chloroflexota bacterium]
MLPAPAPLPPLVDDTLPGSTTVAAPAPAVDASLEPSPASGPEAPEPPRGRRLPRTLESFHDREFRWFYISMLGHMASMNMQLIVRALLAYELTGSYAALGLIGLAGALPMLFLAVFGGVIADRLPKKTVMQWGQFASLINAAVMAALTFAGLMTIEWLLITAAAQGIVMALMMPSRQAMLPDVVGMDRLMNAVSLNMAGMQTMRLFAPALGGFIVGWFGFGWGFTAMSLLYVVALVAMSQVTWKPASAPGEVGQSAASVGRSAVVDIGLGLKYIWREQRMFVILSITFLTSAFGMPLQFLLPAYVADIFTDNSGDAARMAGLLLSVSAVGALVGALFLATIPDQRRGKLFLLGAAILGTGVLLFPMTDNYKLAAVFITIVGLGSTFRMALSQGLLHSYVEDAYRGRVMSVFMTQMAMMQGATFLVGVAAEFVGIRVAIASLGVMLLATTALATAFVPTLRRMD